MSLCQRPASPGADIVVAKHITDDPPMLSALKAAIRDTIRKTLRHEATPPHRAPGGPLSDEDIEKLLADIDGEEALAKAARRTPAMTEGGPREEMDDEEEEEDEEEDEEEEDDEDEARESDAASAYGTERYTYGGGEPSPAQKSEPSLGGAATNPPEGHMAQNQNGGDVEDIIKAMPPEARSAIEALVSKAVVTEVAKARKEDAEKITKLEQEAVLAKAARDADAVFEGVPHEATPLGTLLAKASPEERAALEQVAKAYRALDGQARTLQTVGKRAAPSAFAEGTPEQKLDGIAKDIAKSEGVSYEKAYVLATERNEDLYSAIVERDSRVMVRE